MLKQYVNNLHKELRIGRHVKFQKGFFETEDPLLQAQIEGTNDFGSSIHFVDSVEEMERIGRERQEGVAGEKAKKRKELLDEIAAEEKAAEDNDKKEARETKAQKQKGTATRRLRAADKVL